MEQVHGGDFTALPSLKATQREISDFYKGMSDKIILEWKADNAEKSEKMRIYHHSILQMKIKWTYLGKLETEEGWKVGHDDCAEFLEQEVRELLTKVHVGDEESMNDLLDEIGVCVTDEDNTFLLEMPT